MTNYIEDFKNSEVLLVLGSNTTETHPVIGMWLRQIARYKGVKIIVVDPRKIDLVEEATLWLSPKPGYDIAIVNGMANVIISEGLYNKQFVEENTEGFDDLKQVVAKYTPEYVQELTGISAEKIKEAAKLYATSKASAILYCMGITQHSKGTDNVKALSNLALLCGHIGKPGTGVNPLRGQNNVQGACDMGGLPDVFPGYQKVNVEENRKKFEEFWGVKLSGTPGLTVVEMSHAAEEGRLKALYIMGENPLVTDPDLEHVEKAFKKLELLVVQDIFLTETAKIAHVVLPTASFAEKDGTFTNTERRVQRVRKAINSPGEAKQDWEIICDIATRMGYPMSYKNAEEIFEEIRKVTPQYAGITYNRLGLTGIAWPCPDTSHPGTPILHTTKIARGKGLLVGVEFRPPAETPNNEYPFVLTTGRDYYQYHSATMTRKSWLLNNYCPESLAEINPEDGKVLGIADGDWIKIESRRGHVIVKAKLADRVPKGVVFKRFHFKEAAVNKLTNPILDPISKIPEFKVSAVKIEKFEKGKAI